MGRDSLRVGEKYNMPIIVDKGSVSKCVFACVYIYLHIYIFIVYILCDVHVKNYLGNAFKCVNI